MQWPAQAGAGVERLVAERLGGGGGDHLPDVDVQGGQYHLHLVDQGDVDGPVDVLQQLGGLGHLGGGDGDDFVDGGPVQLDGQRPADGVEAADQFGDGGGGEVAAAGVLPLGGVGDEEVGARPSRPVAASGGRTTSRVVPG